MGEPTIYIFINKGLQMSVGKVAAQAGHAVALIALGATGKEAESWKVAPHKRIMVMQARDEQHLHNIHTYLLQRGIQSQKVVDEGANEIDSHSITALATEIVDHDDMDILKMMSTFDLYRDKVKVTLEVDR